MTAKPRRNRKEEARIERAFLKGCDRVTVPIMELPKIWQLGREVIALGVSDEELQAAIVAYVQKVRV